MTFALSEEKASGRSLKLSVHWTRKGCSFRVSAPSKTSGSWTLVRVEDFFGVDRLFASALIAAARSGTGVPESELACEPTDAGGEGSRGGGVEGRMSDDSRRVGRGLDTATGFGVVARDLSSVGFVRRHG